MRLPEGEDVGVVLCSRARRICLLPPPRVWYLVTAVLGLVPERRVGYRAGECVGFGAVGCGVLGLARGCESSLVP